MIQGMMSCGKFYKKLYTHTHTHTHMIGIELYIHA